MKESEYREGHDSGYVKHAYKTFSTKEAPVCKTGFKTLIQKPAVLSQSQRTEFWSHISNEVACVCVCVCVFVHSMCVGVCSQEESYKVEDLTYINKLYSNTCVLSHSVMSVSL